MSFNGTLGLSWLERRILSVLRLVSSFITHYQAMTVAKNTSSIYTRLLLLKVHLVLVNLCFGWAELGPGEAFFFFGLVQGLIEKFPPGSPNIKVFAHFFKSFAHFFKIMHIFSKKNLFFQDFAYFH